MSGRSLLAISADPWRFPMGRGWTSWSATRPGSRIVLCLSRCKRGSATAQGPSASGLAPMRRDWLRRPTCQELFFARVAQLYARRATQTHEGGRIAMVMPLAALTRGQFRAFRSGSWHGATVRFDEAWGLDNQEIQPLFRVPTCVLFARRTHALATRVPSRVTAFVGNLPFKDAPEELADRYITVFDAPAPSEVSFAAASPYRERFRQGATLVPRMLCLVERAEGGRLGASAAAPLVRSRRSPLEKKPWIDLEPLHGSIEATFCAPSISANQSRRSAFCELLRA